MVVTRKETRDVGDNVRCSGLFKDRTGAVIDPDIVKFSFIPPTVIDSVPGAEVTYTYGIDAQLLKDVSGDATGDAGSYYADIQAALPGTYKWRMFSTGNGQAAEEWLFYVRPTDFT